MIDNQTHDHASVDTSISVQRDDVDTITHSDSSKRRQSRTAARIIKRLIDMDLVDTEVFDPDTAWIERVYAKDWQKSEGAWSWSMNILTREGHSHYCLAGSQWPAKYMLGVEKWTIIKNRFGETSLFPF